MINLTYTKMNLSELPSLFNPKAFWVVALLPEIIPDDHLF